MRNVLMLALVICTVSVTRPTQAQQLLEQYQALLSEKDHFSSNGQRLTSAAAIIRQDRANFHRFGLRDQEDESDRFFADAGNRSALERFLDRGRSESSAILRIVNGTPLVRVEVWRGDAGPFVVVTLVEQSKITNEKPPLTLAAQPHTPSAGSPERVAILGAVRSAMGLNIQFKVNYLAVMQGDDSSIAIADLEDSDKKYPVGYLFLENESGRWRALYMLETDGSRSCNEVSAVYEEVFAKAKRLSTPESFFPQKFYDSYEAAKKSSNGDDCAAYFKYRSER